MKFADSLVDIVAFSEDELEEIMSYFVKERVGKNELLVRQGQVCKKLYFIETGLGRSYYLKKDGKEVTQWFFAEGKPMSSVESFFQQNPSLYYLEVLEDSLVHSITKERLDFLFDKYPKMEKFGRILATEMLTKVVNKLNAIQFQTAPERYEYMLKEFPDISQRVPLGHIASYLGMTQETLSRIRRNA